MPRQARLFLMRRIVIATAAGCVAASVSASGEVPPAAAQPARDPRLERLNVIPADQAIASHAILAPTDLGGGWVGVPDPLASLTAPRCPGTTVDLSRYTLTGQAESILERGHSWILSRIQAYPSRQQALADFTTTTKAAQRCNAYVAIHQLRVTSHPKATIQLTRRRGTQTSLGPHAIRDRILATTKGPPPRRLYIDAIDILHNRFTIELTYLGDTPDPANPTTLAHTIIATLTHQPPSLA
jgi:hypothetical protein